MQIYIPNGSSISSAIFAQFSHCCDRQTDWAMWVICSNKPHLCTLCHCRWCGLIICKKIGQCNLGTGCIKLRLVTTGCPTFAHKITPSHGAIPKSNYLPHPWTHPTYYPKPHPYLISCFATMHRTDRHTDQQMVRGNVRRPYATFYNRSMTPPNNSNYC